MRDEHPSAGMIRANAELVEKTFRDLFGLEVGRDRRAVEALHAYIEENRDSFSPAQVEGLVNTLGSFLGECVVRTFGGRWEEEEGRLGVRFGEGGAVFPFAKVRKQIENGLEDSILAFFDAIPVLFGRKPRPAR